MSQIAPLAPVRLRGPDVAGRFYPEAPAALSAALEAACAQARTGWTSPFKAIIAPHAGLRFSGAVAASAYRALSHCSDIRRVVILAPAHRLGFAGIAAPAAEAFATPLGRFGVDGDGLRRALAGPDVAVREAAFSGEHAIEMQLVFLARRMPQVRILPLLVGAAAPSAIAGLLDRVRGGPDTLLVLSSDLSHFQPADAGAAFDSATAAAIERLDFESDQPDRACGHRAIAGLMDVARRRDLRAVRLDLRSSADAGGDRKSVVGYPAFGFAPARDLETPDDVRITLRQVARAAIAAALRAGRAPPIDVASFPPPLQTQVATFVTLTLDGALRGCIGSLAPQRALIADVANNAVAAAIADPRFAPLSADELARIEIKVSILSHPRPLPAETVAALAGRLEVGREGLILQSGGQRATFLPQVWAQIPNPEEFVSALQAKAGWTDWPADLQAWRFVTETF
jgi:MEMO1 family protein